MKPQFTTADSYKGLFIAFIIIVLWLGSLIFSFTIDVQEISIAPIAALMIWLTFLYTGLFITAHDAMHGIVFPLNKKINETIGAVAVTFYALFSYSALLKKHKLHHMYPGTENDPDFHDGQNKGFWRWYFHFMFTYIGWVQIIGMAIVFNILNHLIGVPTINLFYFWVVPALLSTLQLFYFGTFLPHRQLEKPFEDEHRARSNDYTVLISFVTCYHFGYHWEHHQYPYVAWWKLPSVRKNKM
jgi:beta-carotene ketolase (CrtW type)